MELCLHNHEDLCDIAGLEFGSIRIDEDGECAMIKRISIHDIPNIKEEKDRQLKILNDEDDEDPPLEGASQWYPL